MYRHSWITALGGCTEFLNPPHYHPGESRDIRAMKQPSVYILASRRNGTLYVGVTSNLIRRVWQHKEGLTDGFTRRYGVHLLVWYERHASMHAAIAREKAIKQWKRSWKIELIEKENAGWRDLYSDLTP